jgi:hypothetical protein
MSASFVALNYSHDDPFIPLEIEAQAIAISLDANEVAGLVDSYCSD